MAERTQELEMGRQSFSNGDFNSAINWFQQAEILCRQAGNEEGEMRALEWQVFVWGNISDLQKMAECATRLLSRAKTLNNEFYEQAAALRLCEALGQIDLRNRWKDIKPLLSEGLKKAPDASSSRFYQVYHLMLLGIGACRMGEDEQGFAWLQEALALGDGITAIPTCLFTVNIYGALSDLMRKRGNSVAASQYVDLAVAAAQADGNPGYICKAEVMIAQLECALGQFLSSFERLNQLAKDAHRNGWKIEELKIEYLRADISRILGYLEAGEISAHRAVELAREIPAKEYEVQSLIVFGQVLYAMGNQVQAVENLQCACRLSQERNYGDHFERAEELLGSIAKSI